jgi:membrane associated rhomboid family serine protease
MQLSQSKLQLRAGQRVMILGGLVALLWLIEVFDLLWWGPPLDHFGIRPRTVAGLRNIFFAPFLHAGFGHLIANTIPFLVLGWLVSLYSLRHFWEVTLISALVSGLAIWLLGSPYTVHLGISGVIFGYLGYLLVRGYRERSPLALGLAVVAFLFYGGMVWSLLSWQPGVSWLGHTFGFLGGAWAASAHTGKPRLRG